ncbi:MAG: hypothetical protein J5590_02325 [Clostridia bacterium]|nr:hypothetical protein [Clostridia bacterium]
MKKFFAVILSAALLFSLFGCGGKNAATETPAAEDAQESSAIVGQWKNDTYLPGTEFIYTFNDDGTGEYDAGGTLMKFTYEIDGENISILYDGNTAPFETTFQIDGDTLNVLDSLGNDTLYEKIK